MSNAGRQKKLTPELIERICQAIRAGNYAKVACGLVGISESVYYHWLSEAKKEGAEGIYLEFLESIELAEAEAEVRAVALITQSANNGSLRATQWFLERKHSERWGRKDMLKQEITGADGANIFVTIDDAKKAVLDFLEGDKDGSIPLRAGEGETETATN